MHKMEDPLPYGDGVQDPITSETNLFLAKVTGARTSVFLLAEKVVFQDAFKNDQTLIGTTKTYH